ncbi:hypothetical protein BCO37747_06902 [Burkholderia contaminans]|nr:hypothetical protein BCO23253_06536 [Burkholderia contaminans]VWD57800.1 hypothetical protein BCO37747_06902 [Burkholderia contaminans]
MNEFWPEKPCHASVVTQGGSTRPVEPLPVDAQSASAQYRAPGTCRFDGSGTVSVVFAKFAATVECPLPAELVPSTGPPASYTTCVPVGLKRVRSSSTTYQLNSGNTSLNGA